MTSAAAPRRALVFGASGFIGRWVARALSKQGMHVIAATRDRQRARHVLDRWRVRAEIVEVDLMQAPSVAALVAATTPSLVFNLSGYGVDPRERDHESARRINHDAAKAIAQACAPGPNGLGPTLVHTGSALEYGRAGGVLHEDGEVRPDTVYGITKLAGTRAVAEVARERGTRVVTGRLFFVFGDGEHAPRLFPSLLAASRTAQPIDLTDGSQARDIAFVEDVADALVKLADTSFTPGEVVHVATGRLQPVREFVEAVAAELALPSALLRFGSLPRRPEEMEVEGVSVRRSIQLLGKSLPADIASLVRRAIADVRSRSSWSHDAAT